MNPPTEFLGCPRALSSGAPMIMCEVLAVQIMLRKVVFPGGAPSLLQRPTSALAPTVFLCAGEGGGGGRGCALSHTSRHTGHPGTTPPRRTMARPLRSRSSSTSRCRQRARKHAIRSHTDKTDSEQQQSALTRRRIAARTGADGSHDRHSESAA
jgi:hypothetical protein